MRIRKRFPSFPIVPSSVASSKEALSQQEEMEVSSFPALGEGTAREAPERVLTDWEAIKARAHMLLGCSCKTSNSRTIQPHVKEEHSSTNPLGNGEAVANIPSSNERKKKSLLEQENRSQSMVIEQGGGKAGKQTFDLLSYSQMKGNCSGIAILNTKERPVSSGKGVAKRTFLGNTKDGKAETAAARIGGTSGQKERTDALSLSMEVGSSKLACANSSCGKKYKRKAEDEEQCSSGSSIMKKVKKIRSLTSIYEDIRSRVRSNFKAE